MSRNKYRIVKNSKIKQFILSSQKGQQLCMREANMLSKGEVCGLIAIDIRQKHSKFEIFYNVTGMITLRHYLATPLKKNTFAQLLRNVLSVLKNVEDVFFNPENLFADFDRVMVNTSTMQLWFMYVPIQNYCTGYSLKNFLLDIITFSVFDVEEDNEYIRQYIKILNSGVNFSLFDLEEYIRSISELSPLNSEMVVCSECRTKQVNNTNYCCHCGAKLTSETGKSENLIYNPLTYNDGSNNEKAVKSEEKVLKKAIDNLQNRENIFNSTTGELSGETNVLNPDCFGTTILFDDSSEVTYPYLIRLSNGEKIEVNKPSFRIGKEKQYSDYFVSDNGAVSRSHADIITRDNHFYIIDLNSTNGTYVNGKAIPVKKEIEITSGTAIKLANEKFDFYI